eukprot:Ihof_evm1s94 gene=Ihof_evmTU1s94
MLEHIPARPWLVLCTLLSSADLSRLSMVSRTLLQRATKEIDNEWANRVQARWPIWYEEYLPTRQSNEWTWKQIYFQRRRFDLMCSSDRRQTLRPVRVLLYLQLEQELRHAQCVRDVGNRPVRTCLCAYLPEEKLDNSHARILILMHPNEQYCIGTVKLLELMSTHCDVLVSRDFSAGIFPVLDAALEDPHTVLLFPGPRATTIHEYIANQNDRLKLNGTPSSSSHQLPRPVHTVIAVDGSWRMAHFIWRWNPRLHKVSQVVANEAHSIYGELKHQPKKGCLSTAEAVGQIVGSLQWGDESVFMK